MTFPRVVKECIVTIPDYHDYLEVPPAFATTPSFNMHTKEMRKREKRILISPPSSSPQVP
jgi:hypothetical protein